MSILPGAKNMEQSRIRLEIYHVNTFKHKIKENFFKDIQRKEDDVYVYY